MPFLHIILVLFTLPAPAPQANAMQTNQATPPTSPRQELRALTRKWDQAMVRKDVDFLDEVLAQDYSFAHTPRSYYLAQLKTPGVEYSYHERTINEIRTYGDASLVFSHISVKGKFPGVDWFWSDFNSMDVWIWQNGQWKCVATMHDDIKGETSRGKVQVGPHVKADLVIVFKSGTSEEQINTFLRTVLQRPKLYGEGYEHQPGVRGILRIPPIDGFQALAVSFHPDAGQAEKEQIKTKIRSASLVERVFEDIAPNDVRLK